MDLRVVIAALRTRMPTLTDEAGNSRVFGAMQFSLLTENASVPTPSLFVVPLDDSPDDNSASNVVRQFLVESFAVIAVLDNTVDERGDQAKDEVFDMRTRLWKALLGWQLTPQVNGIEYQGGSVLRMDRARLWYQFEFGMPTEIGKVDGYQQGYLETLPALEGFDVKVDAISPMADKNIKFPGPDGRIEAVLNVDLPAPPPSVPDASQS